MIGLLRDLVNLMVCWIETALVTVLNMFVLALGSLVGALVAVLPFDMPEPPTPPAYVLDAFGWIAWFFPIHQAVLVLTFAITAWLGAQALLIALRWAKATSS